MAQGLKIWGGNSNAARRTPLHGGALYSAEIWVGVRPPCPPASATPVKEEEFPTIPAKIGGGPPVPLVPTAMT